MNNKFYKISFFKAYRGSVFDSIRKLNKNMLEIFYYDLDSYPKDYLIENLLEIFLQKVKPKDAPSYEDC
jgi:hypothetical protein